MIFGIHSFTKLVNNLCVLEDNEKKILAAKKTKFDITKKCLEQGLNKDPPAC